MKIHQHLLNKAVSFALILALLCAIFPALPHAQVSAAPTNTTTTAKKSPVVVSLGDSFSAGESIDDFYGSDEPMAQRVNNQDWLAHRSQKSWPSRLTFEDGEITMKRGENWYFAAASGAVTDDLKGRQEKSYNKKENGIKYKNTTTLDPQLDIFRKVEQDGKTVDYVTMTMGGNDANFTNIIKTAVIHSTTASFTQAAVDSTLAMVNAYPLSSLIGPVNALNNILEYTIRDFDKPGGIRNDLYQAYHDIADAAPQAKIIIAGYPTLLDESGKGGAFSKEEAQMINNAVRLCNTKIENLVNECKAEGLRICFVPVEKEFAGKEAYTQNAAINGIVWGTKPQDLKDKGITSAYSIHPNDKGAQIYADCVQKKIDSIEADGGKSEWPLLASSDSRDIVLVLDTSGSMSGTPLNETKAASEKFVETVLKEDASVGIVTYESDAHQVTSFTKHPKLLQNSINSINSGGNTNIEAGLKKAEEMLSQSTAEKKIIVLMSDGEPNEGLLGDNLIAYADELKEQDIYIYTLGFFYNMGYGKSSAQLLMEGIASEGCHYEVSDADSLVFFFGDIADHINGQKYIYVRIACPVDVTVSYNGEKLTSKDNLTGSRTSFGTLTFEENDKTETDSSDTAYTPSFGQTAKDDDEEDSGEDTRIKVLRLKDNTDYNIQIEGNGKGTMEYTIGLMDDSGEYTDMRKFPNIKITKKTVIDTVASNASATVLNVDEDGDGDYDLIYMADANGKGRLLDNKYFYIVCTVTGVSFGLLIATIVFLIKEKKRQKTATATIKEA